MSDGLRLELPVLTVQSLWDNNAPLPLLVAGIFAIVWKVSRSTLQVSESHPQTVTPARRIGPGAQLLAITQPCIRPSLTDFQKRKGTSEPGRLRNMLCSFPCEHAPKPTHLEPGEFAEDIFRVVLSHILRHLMCVNSSASRLYSIFSGDAAFAV